MSDFVYEQYSCGGGAEWMLRIGRNEEMPILVLPPLFEEMNRTRALLVATMRALAAEAFCCWLPDLPGSGESERDLAAIGWDDWRRAATAAAGHVRARSGKRPATLALRGGALLDDEVEAGCRWRLAPADGASLLRDLERAETMAGGGSAGEQLAGYPVAEPLREALRRIAPAEIGLLRTARLESDRKEADVRFRGPALWRRSEPGRDAGLAAAIAGDFSYWHRQCAGLM